MPRGSKEIGEIGRATQFNAVTAVEANRKSRESARANATIRRCLKGIATEALYGKPPVPLEQLKPVAKFFGIAVGDVTFAHLAIFKQSVEMAKGDIAALNVVAAYAGEKPSDRVEISAPDMSALDAAFNGGEG